MTFRGRARLVVVTIIRPSEAAPPFSINPQSDSQIVPILSSSDATMNSSKWTIILRVPSWKIPLKKVAMTTITACAHWTVFVSRS